MSHIGTFARRFPELKDVILEWEECLPSGEILPQGTGPFPHSMRAAGGRFEPLLACQNPRCQGGGFEVEFLVESMMSGRQEERTGLMVCMGVEQGQGSRKDRTPCTAAIRYRIRLSYREPVGRATQEAADEQGEAL